MSAPADLERADLLTVEDLTISFGVDGKRATVVDRVGFSLKSREIVALVGESGSGKTVTARAIIGLLPQKKAQVERGSVRFLGQELIGAAPAILRQVRGAKIAMIFQEPETALNPVLSIGYQIAEAITAHQKFSRSEVLAKSLTLLEEVGLSSPELRLKEYPHQLSGGMKQRVLIAMALAQDPELLIADEPTTALDVTLQAQVLSLLLRLCSDRRAAVLLITHDLGVVAEVADRVMVMYAGQVVEDAPIKDLFDRPRHPYTKRLLELLPRRSSRTAQRLPTIPGATPDPFSPFAGCRFAPRCHKVEDRCRTENIPLLSEGARRLRCLFPENK